MKHIHKLRNNDNRFNLLKIITDNPGIRYMELKRITKFSYGTLTYHLTRLERDGRIKVLRTNRKNMYYNVEINEPSIIECLRCKVCNKILNILLSQCTTESTLVNILSIPRSTLRYHVKRLRERSVINYIKLYKYVFYYINDDKINQLNEIKNIIKPMIINNLPL